MWLFNRKQEKTNLKDKVSPTAVKEYYQAVGNQQNWLTWVLSILAFIITLLIVLGLFWGGRWAWNKINDDNQTESTQTTQEQSADDRESAEQDGQRQGDHGASSTDNNSGGSNAAPGTPAPAPAPTPQPQPAPNSTPMPQTGDSLPATGPTSDE